MSHLIYVLNGPNLNLLGTREPEIYGTDTLEDIAARLNVKARNYGAEIIFKQSNHEGELVDWIHEAARKSAALIINPAAYSHTSIALLDAILASDITCIEVHLSNIFQREEMRHHSFISQAASGVICGCGAKGYELAVDALANILDWSASENS